MGDNFSKQGELDLYFCCPSHSAELGGEGRYMLVLRVVTESRREHCPAFLIVLPLVCTVQGAQNRLDCIAMVS